MRLLARLNLLADALGVQLVVEAINDILNLRANDRLANVGGKGDLAADSADGSGKRVGVNLARDGALHSADDSCASLALEVEAALLFLGHLFLSDLINSLLDSLDLINIRLVLAKADVGRLTDLEGIDLHLQGRNQGEELLVKGGLAPGLELEAIADLVENGLEGGHSAVLLHSIFQGAHAINAKAALGVSAPRRRGDARGTRRRRRSKLFVDLINLLDFIDLLNEIRTLVGPIRLAEADVGEGAELVRVDLKPEQWDEVGDLLVNIGHTPAPELEAIADRVDEVGQVGDGAVFEDGVLQSGDGINAKAALGVRAPGSGGNRGLPRRLDARRGLRDPGRLRALRGLSEVVSEARDRENNKDHNNSNHT